ncbi:MAG: hypothetical protein ACYC64_11435 [Armatimonadota bacterium]
MNIRIGTVSLVVLTLVVSCSAYAGHSALPQRGADLAPKGQWHDAVVPDTLDLAQRARCSINVLTSGVEPKQYYSVYQCFSFGNGKVTPSNLTWNITGKYARALPLMRVMSGSRQNLDVELAMMQALVGQINSNGLMLYPYGNEGAPSGSSYPLVSAITVMSLLNWYQRDRNPAWLNFAHTLCDGLNNFVVRAGDRAYYPPECGVTSDGQWHWSTRGQSFYPYNPPEEMTFDQQGFEGSAKFEQSQEFRVLALGSKLFGKRDYLDTARKVAQFCLKPGMWEDTTPEGYPGNEHGIFAGHFHGNITTLHGLLDLALVENDSRLKQIVKEGYDQAVRNGVVRMGWFPSWIKPDQYKRPAFFHGVNEGCGVGDVLILAVKLTDAGLGDYWDDVGYIVRNHLSEQQVVDLEQMRKCAGVSGGSDEVLKKFIGGFGMARPNSMDPFINGCCSANGAISLYYAWHGITRYDKGIATVNLFLNRASKWMDIDSYLPYEGKVVLKNKMAHTALVRIPGWLDSKSVRCYVNNRAVRPAASNGYLIFEKLKKGSEIRLMFPVPESKDSYTIDGQTYTVCFRGDTVMEIEPKSSTSDAYPIYRRDSFRASKAPMRKASRFVSSDLIPLQ